MTQNDAKIIYNEIYRNFFYILGFKDSERDKCEKITEQAIKEIIESNKENINYTEVINAYKK